MSTTTTTSQPAISSPLKHLIVRDLALPLLAVSREDPNQSMQEETAS